MPPLAAGHPPTGARPRASAVRVLCAGAVTVLALVGVVAAGVGGSLTWQDVLGTDPPAVLVAVAGLLGLLTLVRSLVGAWRALLGGRPRRPRVAAVVTAAAATAGSLSIAALGYGQAIDDLCLTSRAFDAHLVEGTTVTGPRVDSPTTISCDFSGHRVTVTDRSLLLWPATVLLGTAGVLWSALRPLGGAAADRHAGDGLASAGRTPARRQA